VDSINPIDSNEIDHHIMTQIANIGKIGKVSTQEDDIDGDFDINIGPTPGEEDTKLM
jgi:hypothetical protein